MSYSLVSIHARRDSEVTLFGSNIRSHGGVSSARRSSLTFNVINIGNKIGDSGAIAIAESVKVNTTLLHLELTCKETHSMIKSCFGESF